jgi:hypothetical protein
MPTVDPQQLRALVAAVIHPDEKRRILAVQSDSPWTGPDLIDGPIPVHVVDGPSPLAVRAALVDHDADDRPGGAADRITAVITPCNGRDLGIDVLARLVKGRVLPVDPFSAVLALFGAKVLDPTLVRDTRWMLDDLIALAPPGGWPDRPTGGVLDADTAWDVWHRERLGRPVPADLDSVLAFGDDPAVALAVGELDDIRRQAIATRWAGGTAPVARLIGLIAIGHGPDLGAYGLAADVLWHPTDDARLAEQQRLGRARLENVLGRDELDDRATHRWADAVRCRSNGDVSTLDRAEQILEQAGVSDLAVLSDDLVRGLEHRVTAVARAVDTGDVTTAVAALEHLRRHRLAASHRNRVRKAEAAVRLARRNTTDISTGDSDHFPTLADRYAGEGAWVDELRLLLADGDQLADVAAVYARLCERLDVERRTGDLAFARSLADWSASEPVADERIIPLEHVLDRVVARCAADAPVLVVVADGVGLPVAHQLLTSLAEHGWARATPADTTTWPVGVALLPTVTEVSRTSLLTGTRTSGGQAEELAGFAGHPALRRVSSPTLPPVLFHKGRLAGASGYALADDVQTAVSDTEQRIVGVVINAVDDHLSRGQQIKVTWDVDTMGPLAALLEAARDAGRVIVLTADHGHVIHGEGATARRAGSDGSDGGERWRASGTPAADDEVEITGPRVIVDGGPGGRAILPADDRIRYAGHKHGYHGGACPHEVLVPVEVIARSLPAGWVHRPLPRPVWWDDRPSTVTSAAPAPTAPKVTTQPTLFEPEPAPVAAAAGDGLVDRLLASPTYAAQRERNARAKPISDDRIRRYLQLAIDQGGTIPLATLADRTGEPADQLRMSLMMVRRLLNFDGTEVLALSAANDVELNDDILRLQFGLTDT